MILFTVIFLIAALIMVFHDTLYDGYFVLSDINQAFCSPIIQYMYPFYFMFATLLHYEHK